jgi:trans-2,3-dihydro-3-hydroxyanthranilate isomerase
LLSSPTGAPDDPSNHFKVRIFTPGKELPMAGHPTVGTAYVLAREGRLGDLSGRSRLDVRFEEGVGVIPVSIEIDNGKPRTATMTQPLPMFGEIVPSRRVLAEMLSLGADDIREDVPAQVVSCGVPFFVVPIASLDGMRRARVNFAAFEEVTQGLGLGEVFLFSEEVENNGSTVHSRMFAPGFGITEDPATGGASGPLGSYLVHYGLVQAAPTAHIVSEQGIEMGRPSFIHITITQEDSQITLVQVGGECVYVGRGQLEVPAG